MTSLSNLRIAAKVLLTLGLFALLSVALTAYSLVQMRELARGTDRIVSHEAEALRLAALANQSATQMHQLAFEMVAQEDTTEALRLKGEFDREAARFKGHMAGLKGVLDPSAVELFNQAERDAAGYVTTVGKVVGLLEQVRQWEALNLLRTEGKPLFEKVDKELTDMVGAEEKALARSRDLAHETYVTTSWYTVGTAALGLLLVGAISLLMIRRQITGPIARVTGVMDRLAADDLDVEVVGRERRDEIGAMARAVQVFKENGQRLKQAAIETARLEAAAAEERRLAEEARAEAERKQTYVVEQLAAGLGSLADGDLTFRLKDAFAAEYEQLRSDFNGAIERLEDTISVIAGNAESIRSGTGEISSAADDLSRRTEQQAASLEQTAAALDEITATVKKTAEGAGQARTVVSSAKTDAEKSGEVVRRAVSAMGEIEESARQISQIIGVIDEIAFQTNLLALNAGVEAARAGEAGKGFAVVASEVRGLAQRSAEAAKEIKALISKSSTQVESGVELVGETGRALERILAQVGEINGLVVEIAASAQEQSTGLAQVNTAVNAMDQATQQNAAMVEESTAASQSLAREVGELARLLSQFQVSGEARAPAKAAPATEVAPAARPARPAKPAGRRGAAPVRGNTALAVAPAAAADDWEEF